MKKAVFFAHAKTSQNQGADQHDNCDADQASCLCYTSSCSFFTSKTQNFKPTAVQRCLFSDLGLRLYDFFHAEYEI